MPYQIKRVYEPAIPADGARVLVDRLWPRGVSKERAQLTEWLKDVAPSPELRTWFGHLPERFGEFSDRYRRELATDPVKQRALAHLRDLSKEGRVTLLYAARDEKVNHALVLRQVLEEMD